VTLKAVISDLDGVLIDSEAIKAGFWREILAAYGVHNGAEWYANNKGAPGPELARKAVREYRLAVDPAALAQKNRELHLSSLGDAPAIPANVDFLQRLSCPLAVASSMYSSLISFFVKRLGLESRVQVTVSGAEDVGRDKPAPDIYLLAAVRLGVEPRQCLVIEDSLPGVAAAKAAGMYCAGYGIQADICVKDFSVHSLRSLERLLA